MSEARPRPRLRLVVVGHVDHGKSTIVSALLRLAGALPQGIDALKDERARGITIAASRAFFKTALRDYLIVDAPGHSEFLKNMVTGASQADAALLVLDAAEGVRENSRRHAFLLGLLGIRQAAVLVNKMDLAGWSQEAFQKLRGEFAPFLRDAGVERAVFVPVCGVREDNLNRPSARMAWHAGPTVLEALDSFAEAPSAADRPFRMPVQDVYSGRFAGTVESGALRAGEEVLFLPSGRSGVVRAIEEFPAAGRVGAPAGAATAFSLETPLAVGRGELACHPSRPPRVGRRLRARLIWLGREPFAMGRDYSLKLGTAKVGVRLESVERVVDTSTLQARAGAREVACREAADCVLSAAAPVAFDLAQDDPSCGRFVIVDGYEICGGGLIVG